MAKIRKHIAWWGSIGFAILASYGVDALLLHHRDERVAQAAYNYGKLVGTTLGMCDMMESIARANPDSDWAHDPAILKAEGACIAAEKKHEPAMAELIPLTTK